MNKSIIDLCESNQRQFSDKGVTLLTILRFVLRRSGVIDLL